MHLSIVAPAYNEEKNILPLFRDVTDAMGGMKHEFILVDDGSSDGTWKEIMNIDSPSLNAIRLGRHGGKCLALYRGMCAASGDVIATMDSDLQDDPRDIPAMVREVGRGYDLVCGRRLHRKDGRIKIISSRIGNVINNAVFGLGLNDCNCPLRVFRKECMSGVGYVRDMHRFIPAIMSARGFRIKEMDVGHRPRVHGKSNYGILDRIPGSLSTMLMIRFGHKEMS